uniref:Chemokine interleukin-8-like domain-containing protein n=1 Tax=Hippocampus comes TaxID=109280 RepID=A0A3Q2XRQ4_HIPCM
ITFFSSPTAFFCLFILCVCVFACQILINCCLSVSGEKMPIRAPLVDYDRQVAGSGCSIDAIVFLCRGGAKLCMATDAPGVRRAMRRVDRLKKVCRNKNYRGARRCVGEDAANPRRRR